MSEPKINAFNPPRLVKSTSWERAHRLQPGDPWTVIQRRDLLGDQIVDGKLLVKFVTISRTLVLRAISRTLGDGFVAYEFVVEGFI